MSACVGSFFSQSLRFVVLHVVLFVNTVDNSSMVSVGSLVKLKYKTLSTVFDPSKGLIDCWIETQNPGVVVGVNNQSPVIVCDIAFGDSIFYGIQCENLEILEGGS